MQEEEHPPMWWMKGFIMLFIDDKDFINEKGNLFNSSFHQPLLINALM